MRIGDTVLVRRAGDVIPFVAGVLDASKRTGAERDLGDPSASCRVADRERGGDQDRHVRGRSATAELAEPARDLAVGGEHVDVPGEAEHRHVRGEEEDQRRDRDDRRHLQDDRVGKEAHLHQPALHEQERRQHAQHHGEREGDRRVAAVADHPALQPGDADAEGRPEPGRDHQHEQAVRDRMPQVARALEGPEADRHLEDEHRHHAVDRGDVEHALGHLPGAALLVDDPHQHRRRRRHRERGEQQRGELRHPAGARDRIDGGERARGLEHAGRADPGVEAQPAQVDAVAELEQHQRQRHVGQERQAGHGIGQAGQVDQAAQQPHRHVARHARHLPGFVQPFAQEPGDQQHQRPGHGLQQKREIGDHGQALLNGDKVPDGGCNTPRRPSGEWVAAACDG